MTNNNTSDPLAPIREANTNAPNFDLNNSEILEHLTKWQSLCSFNVISAKGDRAEIEFITLPQDMDAFAQDLYSFCPDLVDQGTGCVHEMVEMLEETGEELTDNIREMIEGIDFTDEKYGVEILKREIQKRKKVILWWD
jgi:hypothetical protein